MAEVSFVPTLIAGRMLVGAVVVVLVALVVELAAILYWIGIKTVAPGKSAAALAKCGLKRSKRSTVVL